jgi:hypothetical protein
MLGYFVPGQVMLQTHGIWAGFAVVGGPRTIKIGRPLSVTTNLAYDIFFLIAYDE